MKNYRNGIADTSPPLHHADLRPCYTGIATGNFGVVITPGPLCFPIGLEGPGRLRSAVEGIKQHVEKENHHG